MLRLLMYLRLRQISYVKDLAETNTQENFGMEAPVETATMMGWGEGLEKSLLSGILER